MFSLKPSLRIILACLFFALFLTASSLANDNHRRSLLQSHHQQLVRKSRRDASRAPIVSLMDDNPADGDIDSNEYEYLKQMYSLMQDVGSETDSTTSTTTTTTATRTRQRSRYTSSASRMQRYSSSSASWASSTSMDSSELVLSSTTTSAFPTDPTLLHLGHHSHLTSQLATPTASASTSSSSSQDIDVFSLLPKPSSSSSFDATSTAPSSSLSQTAWPTTTGNNQYTNSWRSSSATDSHQVIASHQATASDPYQTTMPPTTSHSLSLVSLNLPTPTLLPTTSEPPLVSNSVSIGRTTYVVSGTTTVSSAYSSSTEYSVPVSANPIFTSGTTSGSMDTFPSSSTASFVGETASPTSSSDASVSQPTSWSTSSSYSSSDSSSTTRHRTSSTTNPYWYADASSLKLAPSTTESAAAPTATSSKSIGDDPPNPGSSDNSGSGNSLPSVIVPSDAAFSQPVNTTSVSVLFKSSMAWSWVVNQADLTAQIFGFMPSILAQAVHLDASNVTTIRLQGYEPSKANSFTNAHTIYLAYIPSAYVEELQNQIQSTSSTFYTAPSDGAAKELARQVEPTFNILTAAGVSASGQIKSTEAQDRSKRREDTLKNSLIGVGCSLAGCIFAVFGYLFWKRKQKNKSEVAQNISANGRRGTIHSFGTGNALRETWAPNHMDQQRSMTEVGNHSDGFGGYASPSAADPFQDQNDRHSLVNNRSSRFTERSGVSEYSQMTEAQRIQYEYEASQRSTSPSERSISQGSHDSFMASHYQSEYVTPQQYTTQHAFGPRASQNRTRRRGSVASSIISRPEMTSNSMLL